MASKQLADMQLLLVKMQQDHAALQKENYLLGKNHEELTEEHDALARNFKELIVDHQKLGSVRHICEVTKEVTSKFFWSVKSAATRSEFSTRSLHRILFWFTYNKFGRREDGGKFLR